MAELNSIERQSLAQFLAVPGPVRAALYKFSEARKQHHEQAAAQSLRSIPRQLEIACDAAAKAEVYFSLMADLERFSTE